MSSICTCHITDGSLVCRGAVCIRIHGVTSEARARRVSDDVDVAGWGPGASIWATQCRSSTCTSPMNGRRDNCSMGSPRMWAPAWLAYVTQPWSSSNTVPMPEVSMAARIVSFSNSYVRVASRSMVMSANTVSTALGRAPSTDTGWAFTLSHTRSPLGWLTPITAAGTARPVRNASMAGWVSPAQGVPSSRTALHRGSIDVLPDNSPADRPRTRSAAGFQLRMFPSRSWNTNPSVNVSKMRDLRCSLSSRRTNSARSELRSNSSSTMAARSASTWS